MPEPHLDAAVQALENGDRVAALDSLLDAWRVCRAPQLAAVIDVISGDVARAMQPLDPSDKRAYDAAWADLESKRRAIDMQQLIPGLWGDPKGSIPLRVRALLARGPDPRTGEGLLRMIDSPPMTASSKFSTWSKLFKALPDYADTDALPRLKKRAGKHDGNSQFWPKLTKWIEAVMPQLPAPATLSSGAARVVKGLLAKATSLAAGAPPKISDEAAPLAGTIAPEDALDIARERLVAGDLDNALEALRSFWGARRAVVVADLIERLGALVDETRPRVDVGKDKEIHAAWMAKAVTPAAADVGRLLEALRAGRLIDVEERVAAMSRWVPDPRVPVVMFRFIEDYMIGGRELLWAVVYDQFRVHADVRIKDKFVARCEHLDGAGGWDRVAAESAGMRRARAPTMAAFELATELSKAEASIVTDLAKAIAVLADEREAARGSADAIQASFIADILAKPDDDGPRLVFADWLTENSDPVGEFITLSVAFANGKKVKGKLGKYVRKYKKPILGPLERVVELRPDRDFKRGFLHNARLSLRKGAFNQSKPKLAALLGDWRWSLIEDIRTGWDQEGTETLLAQAPLRSLRRLSSAQFNQLLAIPRPMPLEWLEITHRQELQVDWNCFDSVADMLPSLRTVSYWSWSDVDAPPPEFFETRLGKQLEQIACGDVQTGGYLNLDVWLQRMHQAGSTIRRAELIRSELQCVAELAGNKRTLALSFGRWLRPDREEWTQLTGMLRRIPKAAVSAVTCAFAHDEGDERPAALLEALAHLAPTTVPYKDPSED